MSNRVLNILVVDDEQHQLDTVCRGLFLYGYSCHGVLNAHLALELLDGPEGDKFDLLLTDLTMPGDSGVHLIDQVRQRKPDFPVVVITGLAASKELESVRDLGISILQKPFEPDTLVSMIRSCF